MKRKHFDKYFQKQERHLNGQFGNSGQVSIKCDYDGRNAGAIATYVNTSVAKLLFLNVDLPKGNYDSGMSKLDEKLVRQATLANNRLCLTKIFGQTIYNLNEDLYPSILFLSGNMNYNLTYDDKLLLEGLVFDIKTASDLKKKLYPIDEFQKERKEFIPFLKLQEGEDGTGPSFLPTWRYVKNRTSDCSFKEGKGINRYCLDYNDAPNGNEFLGWHERILYENIYENIHRTGALTVKCNSYRGLDEGTIHKSSSLGVMATFSIN